MKQLLLAYKKLFTPPYDTRDTVIIIIMAFLLIGLPVTVSLSSKSANSVTEAAELTSVEAEDGIFTGDVVITSHPRASHGKYIKFGNASASSTLPSVVPTKKHFPLITPAAKAL